MFPVPTSRSPPRRSPHSISQENSFTRSLVQTLNSSFGGEGVFTSNLLPMPPSALLFLLPLCTQQRGSLLLFPLCCLLTSHPLQARVLPSLYSQQRGELREEGRGERGGRRLRVASSGSCSCYVQGPWHFQV